ncbi:helix-turn-helix domain-containing protein [Mesorhizobium sp. DCY119]|uniref:helix-turn-helix transcriptional regulator n=1 Tax=Mesorhizobium sp. DCY119 TaxID=2108445 RepID=UPI0018D52935|nr:helix-turn-helix domain-containing protein [Mesorhizobium sp. DCY119]
MFFSTKDAAAKIGKSASWLNKTRMSGTGPVYMKLGGSVRYALPDLEAWLAANRRTAVYDHANDNNRAARVAS